MKYDPNIPIGMDEQLPVRQQINEPTETQLQRKKLRNTRARLSAESVALRAIRDYRVSQQIAEDFSRMKPGRTRLNHAKFLFDASKLSLTAEHTHQTAVISNTNIEMTEDQAKTVLEILENGSPRAGADEDDRSAAIERLKDAIGKRETDKLSESSTQSE